MKAIIFNYIHSIRRKPLQFLGTLFLTIGFALIMGSTGGSSAIPVTVFSDELSSQDVFQLIERWNERQEEFIFLQEPADVADKKLAQNVIPYGVELEAKTFRLVLAQEMPEMGALQSFLETTYREEALLVAAAALVGVPAREFADTIDSRIRTHGFSSTIRFEDGAAGFRYDGALHNLFGFTLFFLIYGAALNIRLILKQKEEGTWDRIVLSPLNKAQIYAGHLGFGFLMAYGQLIVVFLLFAIFFRVDFYGGLIRSLLVSIPYVFAVVSLAVFLGGVVKNHRQMDALTPLVAVSFAMLGGGFWPIEIISSPVLLRLSQVVPLTYGMNLLKGATYLQMPLGMLLFDMAVLVLMGVLLMGLGLNLMERKAA